MEISSEDLAQLVESIVVNVCLVIARPKAPPMTFARMEIIQKAAAEASRSHQHAMAEASFDDGEDAEAMKALEDGAALPDDQVDYLLTRYGAIYDLDGTRLK